MDEANSRAAENAFALGRRLGYDRLATSDTDASTPL
jgi:hypothetical protein